MPSVRILALDPGTAFTGWAFLCGVTESREINVQTFGVIRTHKAEDHSVRARIDDIGELVRQLHTRLKPNYMVIEDFTEQGKLVGKTYKEMSWLTEHLRMLGRELKVPTDTVENGYWKKVLMKAQRVNKTQVQHYVTHNLKEAAELLKGQPTHVWDAVAIGLYKFKLLIA
jgi:Holliday junction resolvasome RuvABC endonuclease subunit